MTTREEGSRGEDVAKQHLVAQGYRFLESNFFAKVGELDLIMESPEGYIVFVEVKTNNAMLIHPAQLIPPSKLTKMRKTAQLYVLKRGLSNRQCRFDLVVVQKSTVIDHIPNIVAIGN